MIKCVRLHPSGFRLGTHTSGMNWLVGHGNFYVNKIAAYRALLFAVLLSVSCVTSAGDLPNVIALPDSPKGGVIVYIGSTDATTLVNSRDAGRFIVQAMLFDQADTTQVRQAILAKKAYGLVSVVQGSPKRFPYTTNLINIVVIDDPEFFTQAGASVAEVARILAPEGMAFVANQDLGQAIASALGSKDVQQVGGWTKIVKPRPVEMDEWTHGRHDAEGTSISQDTVIDYTGTLQWRQGPIWMSPGVRSRTADGKNYYYTEGAITCRDSFNGVLLWTVSVPKDRPRLLLLGKRVPKAASFTAIGKRIYTFVSGIPHLVALDGSTGKPVQHYKDIRGVGVQGLVHVKGDMIFAGDFGVGSVNRKTGESHWMNTTLAGQAKIMVSDQYVLRFNAVDKGILKTSGDSGMASCFNLADGKKLWQQPFQGRVHVAKYGVYVTKSYPSGGRKKGCMIEAFSVSNGTSLWKTSSNMRIGPGTDLHAFDGLIWDTTGITGYDPLTGRRIKSVKGVKQAVLRCVRDSAATVNYFFQGRPLGFINIHTGKVITKQFARNGCGGSPGLLLGNGMIYCFPKQCQCFPMLRGYTGFAAHKTPTLTPDNQRLFKGPAYGTVKKERLQDEYATDWCTYLGNEQRSSATDEKIHLPLKEAWRITPEDQDYPEWARQDLRVNRRITGQITAPTASKGLVSVALPESHRIITFDAATGKDRWSFTSESRVVLPPTFYGKLVLFGGEDGCVYCLRADDGALLWRFQAAPAQRRINVFGQLESHWPVTGGILVKDGQAYFGAGRAEDLDHGITGYKLDAYTGQLAWERAMHTITRKNLQCMPEMPIYADGDIRLAMHAQIFDENGLSLVGAYSGTKPPKLGSFLKRPDEIKMLSSTRDGLLDHTWLRYDQQGDRNAETRQTYGCISAGFIAYNDTKVFAGNWVHNELQGVTVLDIKVTTTEGLVYSRRRTAPPLPGFAKPLWTATIDSIRAIAATKEVVVVAASTGEKTGILVIYDTNTGKKLSEIKLNASPLRWGLAIAGGKIFLSTDQGYLLCFYG
jgi:outer membrane protein assembly factor BamB